MSDRDSRAERLQQLRANAATRELRTAMGQTAPITPPASPQNVTASSPAVTLSSPDSSRNPKPLIPSITLNNLNGTGTIEPRTQ